jgi:hypothetical protein
MKIKIKNEKLVISKYLLNTPFLISPKGAKMKELAFSHVGKPAPLRRGLGWGTYNEECSRFMNRVPNG